MSQVKSTGHGQNKQTKIVQNKTAAITVQINSYNNITN